MSAQGSAPGRFTAVRLAIGTFTIVPVPAPGAINERTAAQAMTLAPLIGLALGAAAGGVAWIGDSVAGPAFAGVAAVAALAILTRALHLDGLADTADGLGSARRGAEALAIMRRSDIGPFGVTTLVLVLLADAALIAQSVTTSDPLATTASLAVAASVGRCGVTWCVRRGSHAASSTGLGAAVIGTVPVGVALAAVGATTLIAGLLLGLSGVAAVAVGLSTAMLVAYSCRKRFGGLTGDTLGAIVELGTLACLLCAVSLGA